MLATDTQVQNIPNTQQQQAAPKPIDFGDGRYSQCMRELFKDSQRLLCLTPEQAEKLARNFGSEMGRLSPTITFKYGKVNKDGKMSLRETCATLKGVTHTYTLGLARCIMLLQEATGFGVNKFVKIQLDEQYQEYLK